MMFVLLCLFIDALNWNLSSTFIINTYSSRSMKQQWNNNNCEILSNVEKSDEIKPGSYRHSSWKLRYYYIMCNFNKY